MMDALFTALTQEISKLIKSVPSLTITYLYRDDMYIIMRLVVNNEDLNFKIEFGSTILNSVFTKVVYSQDEEVTTIDINIIK